MKEFTQKIFTGERALFASQSLKITDSVFADGESPLKESRDLEIENCIFKWKYPLWYCNDVTVRNTTLLETARSGIWYTHGISIENSVIEAPKTFRRSSRITLRNVSMPKAQESAWNCRDVKLERVSIVGDYFGMNSENVECDTVTVTGNYLFDGAANVEVRDSKIISKDAFWNCKNVTVYDSTIIGEYLGWNSENVTFVNCIIESNQGLCYMDRLKLVNCKLINTDLAFEYSAVEADVSTVIDSVKNPKSGIIRARGIEELILEETRIDPSKTKIIVDIGGQNEPEI